METKTKMVKRRASGSCHTWARASRKLPCGAGRDAAAGVAGSMPQIAARASSMAMPQTVPVTASSRCGE